MRRAIRLVALVGALALSATAVAHAAVTSVTGEMEKVGPPSSVEIGVVESNSVLRVFDEQHGVTLAQDLSVDATASGTYAGPTGSGELIPAGSRVNSHFVHGDKIGNDTATSVNLSGTITFDRDVLAVIFSRPNLNPSDGVLGAAGTTYPTTNRGFEAADKVTIGADRRSVNVSVRIWNVTDQLRVVTAAGYEFSGFFPPIDNLPTVNQVRAGSGVPVKFSLAGDQGLDIFAAGSPKSQEMPDDEDAETDTVEETVAAGGSALTYDAAADQYTYVWKTSKEWAGTCRQLILELDDGSVHRADFCFE